MNNVFYLNMIANWVDAVQRMVAFDVRSDIYGKKPMSEYALFQNLDQSATYKQIIKYVREYYNNPYNTDNAAVLLSAISDWYKKFDLNRFERNVLPYLMSAKMYRQYVLGRGRYSLR